MDRTLSWPCDGWLLADINENTDVPGIGEVHLFFFDRDWRKTGDSDFPTGYRLHIGDARLVRQRPYPNPLLRLESRSMGPFITVKGKTAPLFHPASGIRQWYALADGTAWLVGCRDGEGHLVANSYRSASSDMGSAVSGRSAAAWTADLASDDPLRQLRTLVWFSGGHLRSQERRYESVSQEPIEDSLTFESVLRLPIIRLRLGQLRRSKDAWVRDYAKAVLPID